MTNRNIILILAGLFLVFGFVAWHGMRQSVAPAAQAAREVGLKEIQFRENRAYFRNESNLFSGIVMDRYGDGALKSKSDFSNGVMHGLSRGWYTNGSNQIVEHFVRGVSDGIRTKLYPSGQKMSEAMVQSGQLQGVYRRWHENGLLSDEVPLSNNVPHGISRSFHADGTPNSEALMNMGVVVQQKSFKPSNKVGVALSKASN